MKNVFLSITFLCLFSGILFPQNRGMRPVEKREGKRTALVIGNGAFQYNSPLRNPPNDANAMAATLRELGFEVTLRTNLDRRSFKQTVDEWGRSLQANDVALFYYAGHGAEVNGANYLFPTDANPQNKSELEEEAYSMNRVIGKLADAEVGTSIILLDACRNNPFTRSWTRDGAEGGLASMRATRNMFVGFAAMPGATAADGERRNSPYTEGILQFIRTPNLSIDQIFTRVTNYVNEVSNGNQLPFKSSSFTGDFYFVQNSQAKNTEPQVVVVEKNKNEPRYESPTLQRKYTAEQRSLLEQADAQMELYKKKKRTNTVLMSIGGVAVVGGAALAIATADASNILLGAAFGLFPIAFVHSAKKYRTEAERLKRRAENLSFIPAAGTTQGTFYAGGTIRLRF